MCIIIRRRQNVENHDGKYITYVSQNRRSYFWRKGFSPLFFVRAFIGLRHRKFPDSHKNLRYINFCFQMMQRIDWNRPLASHTHTLSKGCMSVIFIVEWYYFYNSVYTWKGNMLWMKILIQIFPVYCCCSLPTPHINSLWNPHRCVSNEINVWLNCVYEQNSK